MLEASLVNMYVVGLIYINLTQIYTFTIGSLTASTVPQKFRFYVENVLVIDSWTVPAASNTNLTGTIFLEIPSNSSSFFYSILLDYSKTTIGCHAFSLQWNMLAPSGPSVPPDFFSLQVDCANSKLSIFQPESFPTCMTKSAISLSSNQLSANSEILVSVSPKDSFDAQRFLDDWTQYDFFLAQSSSCEKNPRQLMLSSKTGSNISLSTIVSQAGNYQVLLSAQSQPFSDVTLFSDKECSLIVDDISSSSLPNVFSARSNMFFQHSYSCVIWRTSFRSKYFGTHTVILRNLSLGSSVQLSTNDQMVLWNGDMVFFMALDLKSHDILSIMVTQRSDSVANLDLQILQGRYFTDDPWSAKKQLVFASVSSGFLQNAIIARYTVLVVAGATCYSRTKLHGHGLSVATEGSPASFSIALQDEFDNAVEFALVNPPHTASIRDSDRTFKASSQHFEINSCKDSNLGCVKYTPMGSGSFQIKFATGLPEIGLVATYFSDLSQSIAVASTFGLTEIATSGNPFVQNSEFAIRWSGFLQKPSPATVTFSSSVDTEFESVFVWIDNILVLVQESTSPITAIMTFEDILSQYEIEVLYTKRSSSLMFGFSFSANQAISYSNSYQNSPSKSIAVFGFPSQLLSFSPSSAKASNLAIITIFGRQLSSTCSYMCSWTDESSQRWPLNSEWQVLISSNILLCGTPSSSALQGLTTLQVIERCGLRVRSLQPVEGISYSNNFMFHSKIVHSNVHRISRSHRWPSSADLLLSGTESIIDAGTSCIMVGRSSLTDVEDYSGPIAVNSGIVSHKLDNTVACACFGQGDWNGVGQISLLVEDSLSSVIGSASILFSGLMNTHFFQLFCTTYMPFMLYLPQIRQ